MREISQRTWRIITELREKASPRYRAQQKSREEIEQEARDRLAQMDYASKPPTASPNLLATIRRG